MNTCNKILTKTVLCFALVFYCTCLYAQPFILTRNFTINDGLPSNHIYDITTDKQGFLWITTDNGVSRFDGKQFQNFNTKNGLPSNDVIKVATDKGGQLWILCHRETPAYFDNSTNKLIELSGNKVIDFTTTAYPAFFVKPDGNLSIFSDNGTITVANGKIIDQQIFTTEKFFDVNANGKPYRITHRINNRNTGFFAEAWGQYKSPALASRLPHYSSLTSFRCGVVSLVGAIGNSSAKPGSNRRSVHFRV